MDVCFERTTFDLVFSWYFFFFPLSHWLIFFLLWILIVDLCDSTQYSHIFNLFSALQSIYCDFRCVLQPQHSWKEINSSIQTSFFGDEGCQSASPTLFSYGIRRQSSRQTQWEPDQCYTQQGILHLHFNRDFDLFGLCIRLLPLPPDFLLLPCWWSVAEEDDRSQKSNFLLKLWSPSGRLSWR